MPVSALVRQIALFAFQVVVLYSLSRILFYWVLQAVVRRKRGGGRLIRSLRLLGNMVHELGHATGYLLSGYRVKELVPCTRDPEGRGLCAPGKPWSPIAIPWLATTAAAMFPLIFGTLVLRGFAEILHIPFVSPVSSPGDGVLLFFWDNIRETLFALDYHNWRTYAFLLIGFSIGAELAPSHTDLRRSLSPLMGLTLLLAGLTFWLGLMHADSAAWEMFSRGLLWVLEQISPFLAFGIIATGVVAAVTVLPAITWRYLRRVAAG